MTQYLLLIHGNSTTAAEPSEWDEFCGLAEESGMFRGGSAIGARELVGSACAGGSSDHLVGYMRFDSVDREAVLALLARHPVVVHGGSVELCVLDGS